MKINLLIVLMVLALTGCATNSPYEQKAKTVAEKEGLQAINAKRLDSVFVSSSAVVSKYNNLMLKPLDFSEVKIINPTVNSGYQTPWELKDEDKAYYQSRFEESSKEYLIDKGAYKLADVPGSTLELTVKVLEIAPLGSKDDLKGRPTMMNVYTRGFGRMTVEMQLRDSVTKALVFTAVDERELGTLWERNDRVQNNIQIRLAFEYWLQSLRDELNSQTKH